MIGKTMDAEAANTLIEKTYMDFLKESGRFLQKLLSSSEIEITETIPTKEVVKELLNKGVLDKDMFLTEEDGAKKTRFKEALMALKSAEETETHPSHTPGITTTKNEEIKPDDETIKSLCEIEITQI